MSNINRFSLRRSFYLVLMELKMTYWVLLFSVVGILTYLFFLILSSGYSKINYEVEGAGASFLYLHPIVILLLYLTLYHFMISKRVRQSDTIAFVSIPVSNEERFFSILLIGFVYFILGWIVMQLLLSCMVVINPMVISPASTAIGENGIIVVIGGMAIYSPISFFKLLLDFPGLWFFVSLVFYLSISQKKMWGWNSTTWWEKAIMIGLFFFVFSFWPYANDYEWIRVLLRIVLWLITFGIYIGSFFRIRYIEQL